MGPCLVTREALILWLVKLTIHSDHCSCDVHMYAGQHLLGPSFYNNLEPPNDHASYICIEQRLQSGQRAGQFAASSFVAVRGGVLGCEGPDSRDRSVGVCDLVPATHRLNFEGLGRLSLCLPACHTLSFAFITLARLRSAGKKFNAHLRGSTCVCDKWQEEQRHREGACLWTQRCIWGFSRAGVGK